VLIRVAALAATARRGSAAESSADRKEAAAVV